MIAWLIAHWYITIPAIIGIIFLCACIGAAREGGYIP